jgi:hypothetical protein
MYRSVFESICDRIANMQTSLSEGAQWALGALCFGFAMTLLVHTLVAA